MENKYVTPEDLISNGFKKSGLYSYKKKLDKYAKGYHSWLRVEIHEMQRTKRVFTTLWIESSFTYGTVHKIDRVIIPPKPNTLEGILLIYNVLCK